MKKIKKNLLLIGFAILANYSFAQQWSNIGTSDIFNANTGFVGIGTEATIAPLSKLEVKNGSVLFDGAPSGAIPIIGAGSRMMWYSGKYALRAGTVNGSQWDDVNIGIASTAIGSSTIASGVASFATGMINNASGIGSGAFGYGSVASGAFSIALGYTTKAQNSYSFSAGSKTIASGGTSTALGSSTTASGGVSFAAGIYSIASGTGSSAFGYTTTASGDYSAAFGLWNTAPSYGSFVIGRYNNNIGTYNATAWVATDPLFVIGNGTSGTALSNALTVLKNGNVGIASDLANNSYNGTANYFKLSVNGSVRAKEIIVNTNWADFVFEKNYKLKTLAEVEKYINANGHLPEIPTATEIETNGGNLGELVKLQMQKIEELTLYMIEQNKKLSELNEAVQTQELEIQTLRNK